MTLNPKVIKVKILGQDYVVRSSAGQKYLNEVSAYVNGKMEEIKASGIDDSQQLRIAVLAAMNITDESTRLYARHNEMLFLSQDHGPIYKFGFRSSF